MKYEKRIMTKKRIRIGASNIGAFHKSRFSGSRKCYILCFLKIKGEYGNRIMTKKRIKI